TAVVCVGLIVLGLWFRVAGVPDAPEPKELKEFFASLPSPDDNETGQIMRLACGRLSDLSRTWHREQAARPLFANKDRPADRQFLLQLSEVVERGWPDVEDKEPELAQWLDEVLKNDVWA